MNGQRTAQVTNRHARGYNMVYGGYLPGNTPGMVNRLRRNNPLPAWQLARSRV
jgi:hypothetical protein